MEQGWRIMITGLGFYDPQIGRWGTIDPLIEDDHYEMTPYAYVYNDPIKLIDQEGKDSTQRANAVNKAIEYVKKNPGDSYGYGKKGDPGSKVECSGLVRGCIVSGGEKDPLKGKGSTGVQQIINQSEKVETDKAEPGNVVTLDNSKSGHDNPIGHTGIIKDVIKDKNGKVIGLVVIESGGTPGSGKSGPRETTINLG